MKSFVSILCLALFGVVLALSDVSFQVLDRGVQSGVSESGVKIVRTERAFEEFLKELKEEKSLRLIEQVDWQDEQVAIVFAGQQPTGGYGVEVKKISAVDAHRTSLEAKITKPAKGQIVTMALTTPYVILKMPRQAAPIKVKFLTD